MKMTIDTANKRIHELQEEIDTVLNSENNNNTYSYFAGETPEIPEYDFESTEEKLKMLSGEIVAIKHAVNKHNTTTLLPETGLTIDAALVKMSMLSRAKSRLLGLIRTEAKVRSSSAKGVSEFTVRNFDIQQAQKAYDEVCRQLLTLQSELNVSNQTSLIEV